jgi:hypothetical protein
MKKIIYTIIVLLIVHCTFNIENCPAQWVQYSNGIGMYNIRSFLLNGTTLFAGSEGQSNGPGAGVYTSSNYGANWSNSGLGTNNVQCLALSGSTILAGTYASGIFLSTNNGGSWATMNNGLTVMRVEALLATGTNLIAGTRTNSGGGIFLNNGGSWTLVCANRWAEAFIVSGNNIFAGCDDGDGVWLSTNNGTNWAVIGLSGKSVYSLAINGTKLFAGTSSGVYVSSNNGINWTAINSGLPTNPPVTALAVTGSNIFAGINNGTDAIYFSSNNGNSWIAKNEGFTNVMYIRAFIMVNNYIYAGAGSQVWRRPLSDFIGIKNISSEIPSSYSLRQNFPNPFNPATIIRFQIKDSRFVTLKVYDILGKEVETLVNEKLAPGTYEASFDASKYSSGVYFYRLTTEGFNETKKMMILK